MRTGGGETEWTFTLGSATALAQKQVGKIGPNALHIGDAIKVKCIPAKDGHPFGFLKSITYPDGHVVVVSGGGTITIRTRKGTTMIYRRSIIWTRVVYRDRSDHRRIVDGERPGAGWRWRLGAVDAPAAVLGGWTRWRRPRRPRRRRGAVHPCTRREGPESSPFQLGVVYGHAPKQLTSRT